MFVLLLAIQASRLAHRLPRWFELDQTVDDDCRDQPGHDSMFKASFWLIVDLCA